MDYLIVKTLHILSATILVGTGFGSAFYLFWTNRSGSVAAQAVVARWVIKADWWLTTPAGIFQPLSGLWLAHYAGFPLTARCIWLTFALYAFAGLCWLPVYGCNYAWRQWRKRPLPRKNRCHRATAVTPATGNGWAIPRSARWWWCIS